MYLAAISVDFLAKLLIIAVFMPMWLPIVKELWAEVNESLIDEGGVLGKELDQSEIERVKSERRRRGASLISETEDGRRAGGEGRGGRARSNSQKARRRGF
ncbi:MAG: hypothetical protein P1V81_12725 [Planctomycetota bacterium]|nr:hypothetical protein [Planctomycetota bacterium]